MELLRCKTRLAVLWVIKAVGFSSFVLLTVMKSGTIAELMSGKVLGKELSEGLVIIFGLWWWIPWVMAWLSLTLKGAVNRWTNFILGIVFAVLLIIDASMNAGQCSTAMIIDFIVGIVVSLLIAWYAWKLPKEEA
jgi:hypothetical protein